MSEQLQVAGRRRASVAAIIVSRDRPDELTKTVGAVRAQYSDASLSIFVIDSSTGPLADDLVADDVRVLHSAVNLGGAGSFAFGMLSAIAAGAEWLWLMDDDGRPLDRGALSHLLHEAETRKLDAVAPIVLASDNPSRFAFPYPVNGRYVFEKREIAPGTLLHSVAHLFNGLLIRAAAVFKVGLPDLRLFIRGDEIDFLYKMRRAGLRFATTAAVAFTHPSSDNELFPVFGGRLHVVYPAAGWKRRNQYRNRGYNFFRNRQFLIIAIDFIRYPYFFLFIRRLDLSGLAEWWLNMWLGLRGRVFVDPLIDLKPQTLRIDPLTELKQRAAIRPLV